MVVVVERDYIGSGNGLGRVVGGRIVESCGVRVVKR